MAQLLRGTPQECTADGESLRGKTPWLSARANQKNFLEKLKKVLDKTPGIWYNTIRKRKKNKKKEKEIKK